MDWEREKHRCEKHQLVAWCMCPNRGLNLQPWHVPWPVIKPATFWYTGWPSSQLGHTGQGTCITFYLTISLTTLHWIFINVASHFNFTLFPSSSTNEQTQMTFLWTDKSFKGVVCLLSVGCCASTASDIASSTFALCFFHTQLPRRTVPPNNVLEKGHFFLSFSNHRHKWLHVNT